MRSAGRLGLVLVVLAFVARATAASSDPFETLGLVRFDSGIRVPDFVLSDLDGQRLSLASPSRAAALIVFWTTW